MVAMDGQNVAKIKHNIWLTFQHHLIFIDILVYQFEFLPIVPY